MNTLVQRHITVLMNQLTYYPKLELRINQKATESLCFRNPHHMCVLACSLDKVQLTLKTTSIIPVYYCVVQH